MGTNENAVKTNPGSLTESELKAEIEKLNLPSNSNKNFQDVKPGKKNREIHGAVRQHKKSLAEKLGETFLADDVMNVKEYLFYEVLVPAIKDTFVNFVVSGVNAVIYGDSRRDSRYVGYRGSRGYASSGYTDYGRSSRQSRTLPASSRTKAPSDWRKTLENKDEAEDILEDLAEEIAEYGQVTVGAYLDMLHVDNVNTDYKWGWVDLSTAVVRPVRDWSEEEKRYMTMWLIDLPRPARLD